MLLNLISYRLFRLRRLIVLTMLPTVLAFSMVFAQVAQPELLGLGLVACFPLIHVLVYPGQWMETIAVSVASVAMIFAVPHLDFTLPPVMRALWFALFLTLMMVLFCAVIWVICVTMMKGPTRRVTLRSTATSKLAPEVLKEAITLHPGRDDDYVTCYPPDADGLFRAILHLQNIVAAPDQKELEALPDSVHTITDAGEVETDAFLTCKIEKSTETEHHVVFHTGEDLVPGVTIHHFEAFAGGTRVTVMENSQPMPVLVTLGMWLEDYATDYLVCEIERAERAPPISNRNRTLRQFVVDLAWLMKPFIDTDQPQS